VKTNGGVPVTTAWPLPSSTPDATTENSVPTARGTPLNTSPAPTLLPSSA
jgi:hypothetical protein